MTDAEWLPWNRSPESGLLHALKCVLHCLSGSHEVLRLPRDSSQTKR